MRPARHRLPKLLLSLKRWYINIYFCGFSSHQDTLHEPDGYCQHLAGPYADAARDATPKNTNLTNLQPRNLTHAYIFAKSPYSLTLKRTPPGGQTFFLDQTAQKNMDVVFPCARRPNFFRFFFLINIFASSFVTGKKKEFPFTEIFCTKT